MLRTVPALSLPPATTVTRRRSLGHMMSTSTVLLLSVIATLIILLALLILFHHNLNATKGYRLRTLEHARTQLMHEQEVLNMQIAKSQALDALKNDPQILVMQKPVKPKYVQVDQPVAAHVPTTWQVGGIE